MTVTPAALNIVMLQDLSFNTRQYAQLILSRNDNERTHTNGEVQMRLVMNNLVSPATNRDRAYELLLRLSLEGQQEALTNEPVSQEWKHLHYWTTVWFAKTTPAVARELFHILMPDVYQLDDFRGLLMYVWTLQPNDALKTWLDAQPINAQWMTEHTALMTQAAHQVE